jgi:hypothetical protein
MSDFAFWLKNWNSSEIADLQSLKDFAQTNSPIWPYGSNDIREYVEAVNSTAPDAAKIGLITTLAQAFADWKSQQRSEKAIGFFARMATGISSHLGSYLLGLFGILITAIIVYGIFYANFLSVMAQPDQARGLITFLFSISTIAIFLLIAVATFWIDKTQVDERFNKAKDLLTLMIGIFGTILGFYYGSLTKDLSEDNASARSMLLANLSTPSIMVAPGDKTTISATFVGAAPPIKYDLYVVDPTAAVNTEALNIRKKISEGLSISESVTIPATILKPIILNYALVASDSKGNHTQGTGLLMVNPRQASQ